MIVGFTGTKEGLTTEQSKTMLNLLTIIAIVGDVSAVHGDCIGGDTSFHSACVSLEIGVLILPGCAADGSSPSRSHCQGAFAVRESKPYRDRDLDIATIADFMFVCPKERDEQIRSGTWMTYRMARKLGKVCVVIFPDGGFELR